MKLLPEDKIVVEKIRRGDMAAFEKLFKDNYRSLCYYAGDILKEQAAAEEVVGDFFLKLWEKHESIEIHDSLKAYMYSSIRNNCLKNLEHLKVLQKYHDYATYTLQNIDLLYPEASYPLDNLISQETVMEIEKAIDALPVQCREVFNLSRFEELSYEEIAQHLNVSINTVRTQMSRALQKLRERLKQYTPLQILLLSISLFNLLNRFI